MTLDWADGRVGDGVAQEARLHYALRSGYFRPQERALHDHLAMAARLAAEIRLPGGAGVATQNWTPLFDREPAVAMAEILAMQLDARRLDFETALDSDPEAAVVLLRQRMARLGHQHRVLQSHGYTVLAEQISGLGDDVETADLLALIGRADALKAGELAVALSGLTGDAMGDDAIGRARAARRILFHAHEHLLAVYTAIHPRVVQAFKARIASGNIDPALGLLISQFRLLGDVQDRMNRFVDRHTRFYYRDLLGQVPRPATPETVLLRFLPAGPPTLIKKGTRALGRVSGVAAPLAYDLQDSVRVVSTQVLEARNLNFDRDPLISSQRTLGYVTGVRGAARRVDGSQNSQRLFAPDTLSDVDMGIDIASNILRLAEGRRTIIVRIGMRLRQQQDPPGLMPTRSDARAIRAEFVVPGATAQLQPVAQDQKPMILRDTSRKIDPSAQSPKAPERDPARDQVHMDTLRRADSAEKVRESLGQIVAETLVERRNWPTEALQKLLLQKLRAVPEAEQADPTDAPYRMDKHCQTEAAATPAIDEVQAWFARDPSEVYQQFLAGGFKVSLSTETGPFPLATARAVPNAPGNGPGLTLRMVLDEAVPPIVPEPGAAAPVMRIRLASQSFFCPFSLFEPYAIDRITTEVKVEGLKQLTGFSDDGPVDVSLPFTPFGAIPQDGAAFLVGARELALKSVSRVAADITWAGLPREPGGFYDYYDGYGADFDVPQPTLSSAYLTAEGWRDLDSKPVPMTAKRSGFVGLVPERRIERAIPGRPSTARSGTSVIDFQQRQRIRAGLLKLNLTAPGMAFGHTEYSAALARAMRGSIVPFRRKAMPKAPYTPEIAQISLDYTARELIDVDAAQAARPDQKVMQITPFGSSEIYPDRAEPGAGIFMPRLADGCLFLRLDGPGTEDTVSLLFEMEHGSHKRISFDPPQIDWKFLTASGWRDLPRWSIESDSTDNLMRSGVVRLTLPASATDRSSEMPGQGKWLAICVDSHLAAFPKLQAVLMNGVRAVCLLANDETDDHPPHDSPTSLYLETPSQGIAGIERVGAAYAGAEAEQTEHFRARISERLRHRKRAVTAWDAERLVLDAFPQVWKAKCFPVLDRASNDPVPGAMSVVVVPHAPVNAADNPAQPRMFDVLTLRRIKAELSGLTSGFATVQVSNPSYERLQVRARIGFKLGRDDGSLMQRLKLDVSRFLSVWTAPAPMNGFGWGVHLNDVGAYVANLDYVDFFSELSILQLVADDVDKYRLLDTARAMPHADGVSSELKYHASWALPLPMPEHWIVPARERTIGPARKRISDPAMPTGIGGLAVGQTLVIDRG